MLRNISKEELKSIIAKHNKWLNGEKGRKRADLRCANLSGADLSYANLSGANLSGADLSYANLSDADLSGADLSGANLSDANLSGADLRDANLRCANLSGADLSYANLSGANLSGANLSDANLSGANLSGADLSGANLSDANLSGADLSYANLSGADLSGANLSDANLSGADLRDAENMFCPICCPDSGDFIGWKKAIKGDGGYCIVKLLVTGDRSSATGRKCRCSKADVLEIQELDGETATCDAVSNHDRSFLYKVGETVSVRDFCLNRWKECATGIHFFITREEAVRYRL